MIGWNLVEQKMPPEKAWVMIAFDSGFAARPPMVVIAHLNSEYRPPIDGRRRWIGVDSQTLDIPRESRVFWAPLIELPPDPEWDDWKHPR